MSAKGEIKLIKNNVTIENAQILFRNFHGRETQFNRKGQRNFCVFLDDPEVAQKMIEDGWNVKHLLPRFEGDPGRQYIQVSLTYDKFPPSIYMITKHNKVLLDEDSVQSLDYADIINVDLTIRPYNWVLSEGTKNEKSGVKAYLKTMYVTIEEDALAMKYAEEEFPQE